MACKKKSPLSPLSVRQSQNLVIRHQSRGFYPIHLICLIHGPKASRLKTSATGLLCQVSHLLALPDWNDSIHGAPHIGTANVPTKTPRPTPHLVDFPKLLEQPEDLATITKAILPKEQHAICRGDNGCSKNAVLSAWQCYSTFHIPTSPQCPCTSNGARYLAQQAPCQSIVIVAHLTITPTASQGLALISCCQPIREFWWQTAPHSRTWHNPASRRKICRVRTRTAKPGQKFADRKDLRLWDVEPLLPHIHILLKVSGSVPAYNTPNPSISQLFLSSNACPSTPWITGSHWASQTS